MLKINFFFFLQDYMNALFSIITKYEFFKHAYVSLREKITKSDAYVLT